MVIDVGTNGEAVIALSGAFDAAAAAKLRAICARMMQDGEATSLSLDFTHVREITDVALAALVDQQAHSGIPIRLRGLNQRHNRMLRYLARGAGRSEP